MVADDGYDEPQGTATPDDGRGGRRLGTLRGGGRRDAAAPVRLVREFKGLTVDELLADEAIAELLPGRVRSALQHIERGDLRAAEEALPGQFGPVLPGPGHRKPRRRWPLFWVGWVLLLVLSTALLCWTW